jgi:hypothetical protein
MKKIFFVALTGWTLSLLVHCLSLADIDVAETVPFVWLLHIGCLVVWIVVTNHMRKNEELRWFQKGDFLERFNPSAYWRVVFKATPTWMTNILIGSFFYAALNFMSSMTLGAPSSENGNYTLQSHGRVVKTLTEQEYHHYMANQVRAFSGHWICFYWFAIAVLFKFSGLTEKEQSQSDK